MRRAPTEKAGWILPLALAIAGVAVYANALDGPFIYDDVSAIVENPNVRRLWPPGPALWSPEQTPLAGRPVPSLSVAVNHALGGLDVRGYHAFNVAVHVLNALLLFGLLRRTFEGPRLAERLGDASRGLAFAGALLWTVHPLATECVDYVTQRTESLMTLFYLATLYASVRAREPAGRGPWTAIAIAACGLGMATKESMVTAPLLVLLYDLALGPRPALRGRWPLYAGLAATWAILAALNVGGPRSDTVGTGTGVTSGRYLLNQCEMLVTYLRLVAWPHPLVLDYGYPEPVTLAAAAPCGAIVVALAAATAVLLARRAPPASRSRASSWCSRRPRASCPSRARWERSAGCTCRWRRCSPSSSRAGGSCSAVSPRRGPAVPAPRWFSPRRPRSRGARCVATPSTARSGRSGPPASSAGPGALRAHNNLANQLEEAGELEAALAHHRRSVALREAIQLGPEERARGHYHLGRVLQLTGAEDEAIAQYRAALALWPHAGASLNLGTLLHGRGRVDEAIEHLSRAAEADPESARTHYNLALALLGRDGAEAAIPALERTLELEPDHALAHVNLAGALRLRGDAAAALEHYRAAGRLAPNDAALQSVVGYALADLGRRDEAIAHLERALRANPGDMRGRERLERLRGGS